MYCWSPPATTLSVACKGGARDEGMEGLRKRRVDCWEVRRGRKARIVAKGARRWVFRASDQVEGERDDMGLGVWSEDGRMTKAVRWSMRDGLLGMAR